MKALVWIGVAIGVGAAAYAQAEPFKPPVYEPTLCKEYEDFANGLLHDNSVIFDSEVKTWRQPEAELIRRNGNYCFQLYKQIMSKRLFMTPAQRASVQKYPELMEAEISRALEIARLKRMEDRNSAQESAESCRSTKEAKLYSAESAVAADVQNIAGWRQSVAEEARVARRSGVRNLYNDRVNAQYLIDAEDSLKSDWKDYKKLGGKASSPSKVKVRPDPCEAADKEAEKSPY